MFPTLIRNNIQTGTDSGVADSSFAAVWIEAFGHGQLYLYTFAVFGTVFWLAVVDWRYSYTKWRILFMVATFVLGLYLSSLANFDPTFSKFTEGWVVESGYWLFLAAAALYWALLVFRKAEPETPGDVYTREAQKMAAGLGGLPK